MWQNELLTLQEVAVYLRVNRVTVWRWCKQGTIPAVRIGRSWRVHRDDLLHLSRPQTYPYITEPAEAQLTEVEELSNADC